MGALTLPTSGLVYIDTMTLIYTVERYPAYWPLLEPLWQAAQAGTIEIVSSELTLLETLVGPLKSGNATLERPLNSALKGRTCAFSPSRNPFCGKRPDLRATTKLKTPERCTPPRLDRRAACSLSPTMPPSVAWRVSLW